MPGGEQPPGAPSPAPAPSVTGDSTGLRRPDKSPPGAGAVTAA
jgi:hypothetical protein